MKGGRGRLQRFGLTDTSLEDLKNRTSKTLSKNQEINAAAGRLDKSSCECECPRERQQGLRSIDLSDCRAWAGAGAGKAVGHGPLGFRALGVRDAALRSACVWFGLRTPLLFFERRRFGLTGGQPWS